MLRQTIAGVLKKVELFRRLIDYVIWVTASEMSNERTQKALTSLAFRQACTVEQTGEVQFLEVNHCLVTEDDFEFATRRRVKGVG